MVQRRAGSEAARECKKTINYRFPSSVTEPAGENSSPAVTEELFTTAVKTLLHYHCPYAIPNTAGHKAPPYVVPLPPQIACQCKRTTDGRPYDVWRVQRNVGSITVGARIARPHNNAIIRITFCNCPTQYRDQKNQHTSSLGRASMLT